MSAHALSVSAHQQVATVATAATAAQMLPCSNRQAPTHKHTQHDHRVLGVSMGVSTSQQTTTTTLDQNLTDNTEAVTVLFLYKMVPTELSAANHSDSHNGINPHRMKPGMTPDARGPGAAAVRRALCCCCCRPKQHQPPQDVVNEGARNWTQLQRPRTPCLRRVSSAPHTLPQVNASNTSLALSKHKCLCMMHINEFQNLMAATQAACN